MNRRAMYFVVAVAMLAVTILGAAHMGHHHALAAGPHLDALVGGSSNQMGCVLGIATFSLGCLAGAVVVAATGGTTAGVVTLALVGAYSPIAAAAC